MRHDHPGRTHARSGGLLFAVLLLLATGAGAEEPDVDVIPPLNGAFGADETSEEREQGEHNELRERVASMGMLALIQSSRGDRDDAMTHIFGTGPELGEALRSSLSSSGDVRLVRSPAATTARTETAGWDVRDLLRTPGAGLHTREKRASLITARLSHDALIDVDGALDDGHAARALAHRKDAFRLCYETALKGDRALGGRLVYIVDVAREGGVDRIHLVEDEIGSAALSRCVVATLSRIRFPTQQSDDDVSVTAALSFRRAP